MKQPCVYILASKRNGTLYVGVTSDLVRRAWEHRVGDVEGFTKQYGVYRLVYAEVHDSMVDAVLREKRVKRWRRAWKLQLIERDNPAWRDLYDEFVPAAPGSPLPASAGTCFAGMTMRQVRADDYKVAGKLV
jgi:putative endonuclease